MTGKDVRELIQDYNKALFEGISSEEFATQRNLKKKSLQQLLRRHGYIFNKEQGIYVLKEQAEKDSDIESKSEPNTGIQQGIESPQNKSQEGNSKEYTQDYSKLLQAVQSLTQRVERLEKEAVSIETASTQEEGLVLREFSTPVRQISYRYYEEVLTALDQLCNENKHFTKTAVINSLLMDAIERVKKDK